MTLQLRRLLSGEPAEGADPEGQTGKGEGGQDEPTYEVTVNGRKEQWPLSKIVATAQKQESADERFRQASEMRKEAEKLEQIVEDMKAGLSKQDAKALRRGLINMGYSEEDVDAWMNAGQSGSHTAGQKSSSKSGKKQAGDDGDDIVDELLDQIEQLKAQVDRLTQDSQKSKEQQDKEKVQKDVDAALDSEPRLTRILQAVSPTTAKWIRRNAYSLVAKASDRLTWPQAKKAGIKDLLELLDDAGIGKPVADEDDEDTSDSLPPLSGVGPTSGGPASRLHRTNDDKKVGVFEDGFDEDVQSSLLSRHRKALRRNKAT